MPETQQAPLTLEKSTPYDEFNTVIPRETFPASGMAARAAQAIVNSFAWTDANPELNLSSFFTTRAEPEAVEVARTHMYKNYIDHDMYSQVFKMGGTATPPTAAQPSSISPQVLKTQVNVAAKEAKICNSPSNCYWESAPF